MRSRTPLSLRTHRGSCRRAFFRAHTTPAPAICSRRDRDESPLTNSVYLVTRSLPCGKNARCLYLCLSVCHAAKHERTERDSASTSEWKLIFARRLYCGKKPVERFLLNGSSMVFRVRECVHDYLLASSCASSCCLFLLPGFCAGSNHCVVNAQSARSRVQ